MHNVATSSTRPKQEKKSGRKCVSGKWSYYLRRFTSNGSETIVSERGNKKGNPGMVLSHGRKVL